MASLGRLLLLIVPLALLMVICCDSAPQLSVLPPSLRLGRLLEQAVEDAEDDEVDYDVVMDSSRQASDRSEQWLTSGGLGGGPSKRAPDISKALAFAHERRPRTLAPPARSRFQWH